MEAKSLSASVGEGFTPGPWSCERQDQDEGDIYFAIHGSKYEFITNVYESKANARLIAAAPTLFKCLSDLISNVESGSYESTGLCIQECKAALAKARGETP